MIEERKRCVLCSHKNLANFYTFSNFPVYVGTSDTNNDYLYQDMAWAKCKKCGQIQLKKLIEEKILYAKPHNAALGKTWRDHHNAFVDFTDEQCYGNILELGGGNLSLANKIAVSDRVRQYEVADSNIFKSTVAVEKIIFNEKLFDLSLIEDKKYDFVIHSHVLEHLYEPLDSLKKIRRILKSNGKMIFSVPMINNMLKKGHTNALNFEHTYYLNKEIVEYMLHASGFVIEKSLLYSSPALEDWCLFAICSIQETNTRLDISNMPEKDFQKFIDLNKHAVMSLNEQLKNHRESEKFIFGGHIFTQFLLNFGLENDFICVLDNDKEKHNEFLYGTDLIVRSPKILSEYSNPVVVLRAGPYNGEIKQDILQNINNKTIFLE